MKPHPLALLIPLFIFSHSIGYTQEVDLEQRREKLELILKFQDLRTIHDGKLISFLSDPDPIVRERAVRAFGSIQDSSILNLIVDRLSDRNGDVQSTAAFVINQIGVNLSQKGRQLLEHDLIWARMDRTKVRDRLIEEIGKFGTVEALRDLILRFGTDRPMQPNIALVMSIARFAIRGITTTEAVQYLLKFIKPIERTPWQVVYALQRIGDHKEIRYELEHVVQLFKHEDPIVRMYLAALLGKLKDEQTSIEPLHKMADFDYDWRARVNALKALSNFDLKGKDAVLMTFRRAFYHDNLHIVLTAVSSMGNSNLKEDQTNTAVTDIFSSLQRMSENNTNEYLWQVQAEAVVALAKLKGKSENQVLKLKDSQHRKLQAQIIKAIGISGEPGVFEILVKFLSDDKPLLYRAALEGLQELCRSNQTDSTLINQTYSVAVQALSCNDMAVVTTAALILGDSLFHNQASVQPLLNTLSRLKVPDEIEAIQEITATLGKLKDDRAIPYLRKNLSVPDRSITMASASALKSITGDDYNNEIPKYFEPLFTDFDFTYLRSLPETLRVKMETTRGDIIIDLYKTVAPFTVMSFLKLATQQGFYRGLSFHRVVPNFVIQGGDPRGDGWGGPGYSIRSEFSAITYDTGVLGMASAGKDTEGSQFFITHSPQPHLDGRYTLLGKVVSGMEVVNRIQVDDRIFDIKVLQ